MIHRGVQSSRRRSRNRAWPAGDKAVPGDTGCAASIGDLVQTGRAHCAQRPWHRRDRPVGFRVELRDPPRPQAVLQRRQSEDPVPVHPQIRGLSRHVPEHLRPLSGLFQPTARQNARLWHVETAIRSRIGDITPEVKSRPEQRHAIVVSSVVIVRPRVIGARFRPSTVAARLTGHPAACRRCLHSSA